MTLPPEFKEIFKYINKDRFMHSLRMAHEVKPELTKEHTFIFRLPKEENSYHEPFIELPMEYILSLQGKIIAYKAHCPCEEIIIYNYSEND